MARRRLLAMLVPPLVALGLALAVMWLPLPAPFPITGSDSRTRAAAVAMGVLGIAYLAGLAVVLVSWIGGASRSLDGALLPMGLIPQRHLLVGRRYGGMVQGRSVEVEHTPSVALQPALLNIHVAAESDRRMAIGRTRPLLDCRRCARVQTSAPELAGLHVYAEDVEWSREFLADARNQQLVGELIALRGISGTTELYFQPGRIWLRACPRAGRARAAIEGWIEGLVALAEAAEHSA